MVEERRQAASSLLSPALREYHAAFFPNSGVSPSTLPFVTYYGVSAETKALEARTLTRAAFWEAAMRAASAIRDAGLTTKGDCAVHFFSDNRLEDLVLRLASVMCGTVPVTVNWQADTIERVAYKIRATGAKVVFHDKGVSEEQLRSLRQEFLDLKFLSTESMLSRYDPLPESEFCRTVDAQDTRIIIFTSGTTGDPKGVALTFDSYACNQRTFESFLQLSDHSATTFVPFVANPFHHTNTTAITDWSLRRPGAHLHLLQRYSTQYWRALVGVVTGWTPHISNGRLGCLNSRVLSNDSFGSSEEASLAAAMVTRRDAGVVVVAPLVSKHFDFLESLIEGTAPAAKSDGPAFWSHVLPAALASRHLVVLFGSAPVGPTTVNRMRKYGGGRLPVVRFGSTETCLQVCGTPLSLTEVQRFAAFKVGWNHTVRNAKDGSTQPQPGYYIGRGHAPHTECRVVKSIEIGNDGYMVDAAEGESGLLVTRGRNLMSGYVGNASATSKALHEASDGKYPWYVNFGDVCFTLTNPDDGERDIYWQSRESSLLIKGGANYSYDQINEELTKFVTQEYGFSSDEFALAVIGQRLRSEHEDECCVTVQLPERTSKSARDTFKASFVQRAKQCVGKGSRPDFVRLGEIPRNFKGAVQVKELVARWKATKGKDDDKISGSSKSSPSDLRDAKQSPSSIVTACVLLVATVTVAAILVRHKSKNGL